MNIRGIIVGFVLVMAFIFMFTNPFSQDEFESYACEGDCPLRDPSELSVSHDRGVDSTAGNGAAQSRQQKPSPLAQAFATATAPLTDSMEGPHADSGSPDSTIQEEEEEEEEEEPEKERVLTGPEQEPEPVSQHVVTQFKSSLKESEPFLTLDPGITITDGGFSPRDVTICTGGTVHWMNRRTPATNDGALIVRTAASTDHHDFPRATLNLADSFTWTFESPGKLIVMDALHVEQAGRGVVNIIDC